MIEVFESRNSPRYQSLLTSGVKEVDLCFEIIKEYFEIKNPTSKDHTNFQIEEFITAITDGNISDYGVRIYFPWINKILHIPPEEVYNEVRISRNRNLITPEEQKVFRGKTVGICGMSVGSNVLRTLNLIGGPRTIKIADFDKINVSNLNRIFAPLYEVSSNKADFFARQALELDPFLKIGIYSSGINTENIKSFLSNPPIDLLIEEMDNPLLKIKIRQEAKELGIPVIMAADNGDGAILEVERYDQNKNLDIFNGRLNSFNLDQISESISFEQKMTLIAVMVGLEDADIRALTSLLQVGKDLNTWPQLGTAAITVGVALTIVARKVLLNTEMPSGRYFINYDEKIQVGYNTFLNRVKRKRTVKRLIEKIISNSKKSR